MTEGAAQLDDNFQDILDHLPLFEQQVQELNEIVLANLVMISEIPSPTFEERRRVEFLLERFSEYQLQNTSTDEIGNALGILPGTEGDRNILVVAHMDTAFSVKIDHTVTIQPGYVLGAGIGDNSLGVATVATLPLILEQLGIRLRSNLILMGSARTLGKGNIEGIRFFLNNKDLLIDSGICVEGVKLGRLSYSSLGVVRGEINCRVPEEYDWSRFGASGAIVNINDVLNRIVEIPIPRRPRTRGCLPRLRAIAGRRGLYSYAGPRGVQGGRQHPRFPCRGDLALQRHGSRRHRLAGPAPGQLSYHRGHREKAAPAHGQSCGHRRRARQHLSRLDPAGAACSGARRANQTRRYLTA